MVHKHGRGKAIVKRMRRIMKAGNVLARQLPTAQAREIAMKNAENKARAEEEII